MLRLVLAGLPALAALAALTAACGLLSGCDPVEFGSQPVTPTDTSKATGEATLILYNQRQGDAGDLIFQLYSPTAQHIQDVVPKVQFDKVAFGKVISVKLTAGRWKIAYKMETTGEVRAMPSRTEAEDPDWPVVKFVKGETYQLLVETDEGNNTRWTYNIPIEK